MPAPITAGAALAGLVPGATARSGAATDSGEFATALTELLGMLAGDPDRGTSGDAAAQHDTAGPAADPDDTPTQICAYGATFVERVPDGPAPLAFTDLAGAAAAATATPGELGLVEASTGRPGQSSAGLVTAAEPAPGVPDAVDLQASPPLVGGSGPAVGEAQDAEAGVARLAVASGREGGPHTTGPSRAAPPPAATSTPQAAGAPPAAAGGPPFPAESAPAAANPWPARPGSSALPPAAPAPEAPAGAGVQPAVALQHLTGTSQPAPVAVPPGAQTLAAQLAPSVLTLAASAPGEHVLTIRVAPENLGPVTVQAHIGADGVRIELFSPTDAGRAAMHAVLADLRRDLAGTGIGASLDLSDRGAPAQDPTAREGNGDGGAHGRGSEGSGPALRTPPDAPRPERPTPLTSPTPVRLDVFV